MRQSACLVLNPVAVYSYGILTNCTTVGVCNCSMFCFTLLYVHSSLAIILIGKRESWLLCLVYLAGVCDCCVALPYGAMGLSEIFDCIS